MFTWCRVPHQCYVAVIPRVVVHQRRPVGHACYLITVVPPGHDPSVLIRVLPEPIIRFTEIVQDVPRPRINTKHLSQVLKRRFAALQSTVQDHTRHGCMTPAPRWDWSRRCWWPRCSERQTSSGASASAWWRCSWCSAPVPPPGGPARTRAFSLCRPARTHGANNRVRPNTNKLPTIPYLAPCHDNKYVTKWNKLVTGFTWFGVVKMTIEERHLCDQS